MYPASSVEIKQKLHAAQLKSTHYYRSVPLVRLLLKGCFMMALGQLYTIFLIILQPNAILASLPLCKMDNVIRLLLNELFLGLIVVYRMTPKTCRAILLKTFVL